MAEIHGVSDDSLMTRGYHVTSDGELGFYIGTTIDFEGHVQSRLNMRTSTTFMCPIRPILGTYVSLQGESSGVFWRGRMASGEGNIVKKMILFTERHR